jgi:EthD domain
MSSPAGDFSASYAGPVKRFVFVKRKAGLTSAEFHDHWRERYAPQLAERPELRRHLTRLELHHRLDGDDTRARSDLGVADAGYDGVAVLWAPSLSELDGLIAEPAFQELQATEGPRFRAPQIAQVITRTPDIIVGPPGGAPEAGMSMLCILRRKAGMSLDEYHDHWLNRHGPLFQDIAELRDPLLGYEQNHGLDLPGAEYDGLTQQWFHSLEAWIELLGVPSVREVVDPDVASFLDPAGIAFVLAGPPTVVIG